MSSNRPPPLPPPRPRLPSRRDPAEARRAATRDFSPTRPSPIPDDPEEALNAVFDPRVEVGPVTADNALERLAALDWAFRLFVIAQRTENKSLRKRATLVEAADKRQEQKLTDTGSFLVQTALSKEKTTRERFFWLLGMIGVVVLEYLLLRGGVVH